jgi:hypothetical protein
VRICQTIMSKFIMTLALAALVAAMPFTSLGMGEAEPIDPPACPDSCNWPPDEESA